MVYAKSTFAGLVFLSLLVSDRAWAQESGKAPRADKQDARPQAQEERAAARAEAGRLSGEPAARPAAKGKRPPPRRRSVQQIVGTMPQPSAPSEPYGPVLYQRGPAPVASPPTTGMAPPVPSSPAQVNSCHGAFCTDASGNSYSGGVGNTAINSQGRLCNKVGTTMQCF